MKGFFISYNGQDQAWPEWIAWTLEEAGYKVVIQAWDFRVGKNFVLEMHKAATETKQTIAVLSENYLNAEYTHPEWAAAFARDPQGNQRTLLPIRISPCRPTGLLATRIYADLVGLAQEDARTTLLNALQERGKPDTAPAFPGLAVSRVPSGSQPLATTPTSFPGAASPAVAVWQEKLDFLRHHEAITADPAQKFALKKQIEEVEQKIRELGG